jgi:cytidylate kinase
MIITIDGHAGVGKSEAARMLAVALKFELMNTGAMYRATAYTLGQLGIDVYAEPRDRTAVARAVAGLSFGLHGTLVTHNGSDLPDEVYGEAMGAAASRVGTFEEVREHLKAEQRRIANGRDIICEGRDQGTAVFPDAAVKFFLTATVDARARRRAAQEGIHPERDAAAFAELVKKIKYRDEQDEERLLDPLRKAADAVVIDSSHLSRDEVLAQMVEVVRRCRSSR